MSNEPVIETVKRLLGAKTYADIVPMLEELLQAYNDLCAAQLRNLQIRELVIETYADCNAGEAD